MSAPVMRFRPQKSIIAMIHVEALPGTPRHGGSLESILKKARAEAELYTRCGVDALAIENMHDVPYLKRRVGPEIVAAMTALALEVRAASSLPCGIQILAGANQEALAVAAVANLDFIRAEGFVFGHVADEGYFDSCAGELLRYRKAIGAEQVSIYCDIKKKHSSHAITADVSIEETAKAAEFFLSDGVIVTGAATGATADLAELQAVKQKVKLPVLVGSGVTLDNLADYLPHCDGIVVGSHFKRDGYWENDVDAKRVEAFMKRARQLRG
jgi:membrane complex biogenesis BtpA family protein